jgi:DUF971 family protein
MPAPLPIGIELHRRSRTLELIYSDDERYELSCEYLRVYSPSAEVRGHGVGQEVLQTGKIGVGILGITPVGNYALQFDFDDGHNSGIYSWEVLYGMCVNRDKLWQDYLDRLKAAGKSREPSTDGVGTFTPPGGGGCKSHKH